MGFSKLTDGEIGPQVIGRADPEVGATVLFIGTVRRHNRGRRVEKIFYDAYIEYGERVLEEIRREAIKRFGLIDAYIVHRVGEVRVGEVALVVAAQSRSRGEAIRAVEWMVDRVKHDAPIWKKEFYSDGSYAWL